MKMTRRLILFALIGTLGLVGCGDDDDSTVADGATTTEAKGGGDLATYCDKTAEIEQQLAGEPDIDFETATPEEMTEAGKGFAADAVPLADEIQAAVPEENSANIEVLVAALKKVAETGDFAAFDAPETAEASRAAHAFDLESCGWNEVDVTAVNYEFKGIPETLEAGITSFEFTNEGTELHEMIVLRKNDDTTETFDELLALPEEEARPKTTAMGSAFGAPGEEDVYAVADLTPGDYIAICFIPVGSVDEDTHADGPPHFTKGMKHEFSVS